MKQNKYCLAHKDWTWAEIRAEKLEIVAETDTLLTRAGVDPGNEASPVVPAALTVDAASTLRYPARMRGDPTP